MKTFEIKQNNFEKGNENYNQELLTLFNVFLFEFEKDCPNTFDDKNQFVEY